MAGIQVVQREVPPVVVREPVLRGPVLFARAQPFDAVAQPALHLHHVRLGMHGPRIAMVALQGAPAHVLGTRVQCRLLQAERIHAEDVAVAFRVGIPMRQHLCHPVAQHGRGAEEEVSDVGDLQGEQVAGIVEQDVAVAADRPREVALQPGARRRSVRPFALVRPAAQALDRLDALGEQRQHHPVARHDHETRA